MPTTVDPFTHRTGRVAIVATLLMAAALLASCTSDDANRADGGAMSTTTAAADPEQVEPFEGPVEPRLFEETDLEPVTAEERRDVAGDASASADVIGDEPSAAQTPPPDRASSDEPS